MNVWHLIVREMSHRKLSFALSWLSAAAAVACVAGMMTVLQAFDQQTTQLLDAKQAEVAARGKALNDDYRKITKGLGFNILILPQDQNLQDIYSEGYGEKTMPEEYVTRLSSSQVMTVEHLLPSLEQKIEWPEVKRTIVLIGIRGEVPFVNRDTKKPLLKPVPENGIVLGYELHRQLNLKKGAEVTLLGKSLKVGDCYPQRGNKDDITAWINLEDAQTLLNKTGQINAIWALECNCETIDRLAEIRQDIAKILPDTQIIETVSTATARAEARKRASLEAKTALEQAKIGRNEVRGRIESLASVAVSVVVVACCVWLGLLTWTNVRARRPEIGILRAIGLRSPQILALFLGRSVMAGVCGAVVGLVGGVWIGWQFFLTQEASTSASLNLWSTLLSNQQWLPLALVGLAAPLVAALAGWLPALIAAGQDPARVLVEE